MLKTTRSSKELALRAFRASNNEVIEGGGSKADETVVNLSKSKNEKSKKSIHMPNIGAIEEPNFLTSDAKKAINYLQLAFIKAPILQHFDLESHIWTKTNTSSYILGKMLS